MKRWADPDSGLTRYTAEPHEISLVDLPCVPDATFDVVKGGMIEKRAFALHAEAIDTTVDENIDDDDCAADKGELSAGEREKDAEEDIALPDGSYPIRSAKDIEERPEQLLPKRKKPTSRRTSLHAPRQSGPNPSRPTTGWKRPIKRPVPPIRRGRRRPPCVGAKALTYAALKLDRATAENARLRKALDDLRPACSPSTTKRIAALEAQPLPAKAALRSIAKSAHAADEGLVSADDAVRASLAVSS